jgi:hypothetical protein
MDAMWRPSKDSGQLTVAIYRQLVSTHYISCRSYASCQLRAERHVCGLVGPIRDAPAKLPEWARACRNFVAAFVVPYEPAYTETPLKPTAIGRPIGTRLRGDVPRNCARRFRYARSCRRPAVVGTVSPRNVAHAA